MPVIITEVGRRGQITLPRAIRRKIKIREGDQIAFVLVGDQVLLHPLTGNLLQLRGSVPVAAPQEFAAIRQTVVAAHAAEVASHES